MIKRTDENAGMFARAIAKTINERGWRTKEYVARRSGKRHGDNRWTPR